MVAEEAAVNEFEVHEDNFETAVVFASLSTQWRVVAGGMGAAVYQGIDYAAVTLLFLRSLGVPRKRESEILAGLRIMEAAALPVLNERAQAKPDG